MAKKGYLSLIGADKPSKKPGKKKSASKSKTKRLKTQGAGAMGTPERR